MRKNYFLTFLIILLICSVKTNAQLAVWDFTGDVLTASSSDANVTASDATHTGLTSTTSFFTCNGDAWSPSSWSTSGSVNTTDDYAEYTITANAGFNLSVTGFTFFSRRSSSGPANFSIRSSNDSYASDLLTGTVTTSCSAKGGNFTSPISVTAGNSLTIRIYGYNATSTGNMRMDDVTITGTSSSASSTPTVSFDSASSSINETDATVNTLIPVTFTNYAADVTVSVTIDGSSTAEAGDYTLNTNSLTFSGNGSQNISLDINDDVDMDNETVVLNIAVTSGVADLATSQHTVTITDDDLPEIIISEIMYNTPGTDDEWIEIYNGSSSSVTLTNWTIEYAGGTFTFPATSINNGQYIVIAVGSNGDGTFNNSAPFTPDFNNIGVADNNDVKDTNDTNNLGNTSGTITLKNSAGNTVDTVTYDDGDAISTDGSGNTYEIINLSLDNASTGSNWQASVVLGGSPKKESGAVWSGTTNNIWSTSTNWTAGIVPANTTDILIPNTGVTNYPTISSAVTVNSINIASGASLISNAAVTGNVTYTRNLPTTNWYLVAPPVSGETIENIISNHSLATGTVDVNNLGFAPYTTNPAGWDYQNAASTGTINNGQGYSVKFSAAGDLSFTGSLNTSNVSYTVFNGINSFNLIGNPFTAYVNSDTFAVSNTGVLSEETVWLWDGTQYVTHNNANPIEIAPAQGFFIETKASNNVIFSTANQSHQAFDTFMRQTPTPSFELFIDSDTNKSATKVFYVDGKTTGFDNGYDSKMFGGIPQDFAVFTQLLSDNDGRKLAIQTLPSNNLETMVIPVGLITETDKEITFSIAETNLPTGIQVYLEDRTNSTFVNLSEGNHTITTKSALNGIGQYYIHTTSERLSNDDITQDITNVSIYKSANNEITIAGLQTEASIKVFSILGEELVNTNINSNGLSKVTLPNLSTGVYVVKLSSALGNITKKFILE